MQTVINLLLTGLFCLAFSPNLNAQVTMPAANWDRNLALSVARQADVKPVLKPLYQLVQTGSNSELLEALSSIELDSAIPDPARDFLLFSFVVGLGDLEANAVSPEVLDFLAGYEPKTLVSDEDHPRITVPLFNVRAATAGTRNRWDRQLASTRAEGLLPEQWLLNYVGASVAQRRGYIDALDFASTEFLDKLGWSALTRLDERPELILVVARAAADSGDFDLLQQSLLQGSGPELSRALATVSPILSDPEAADLLNGVLRSGSDSRAALFIAHLAPTRLDNTVVRDILFDTLANRNLGAAAALVLSASNNREIQTRLKKIASEKESLSQKRASWVINTRNAERGAER